MKAIVKDGYLTLIDAGSTDTVKAQDTNYAQYGYFFKVKLPENVLNGTESLVIGLELGAAYAWFEVTEMRAAMIKAATHDNQAVINVVGTSIGSQDYKEPSYWGTAIKTDFQTATYGRYNLVQFGGAVSVNGVAVNRAIQKAYADPSEDAYMQLSTEVDKIISKVGDVLTIDGWFYNETYGAFCVEETSFIYDGKSWEEVNVGTYGFDVSTTSDANPQNGFYLSMAPNNIPVSAGTNGWEYVTIPAGSAFYGYRNNTKTEIRFRKFSTTDWYTKLKHYSNNYKQTELNLLVDEFNTYALKFDINMEKEGGNATVGLFNGLKK